MRVDVCYLVSHGFAARMVLHSRLLHELRQRGLSVAVLLPGLDARDLEALESEYGIQFVSTLLPRGRKLQLSNRIKPYIYENIRENPALWSKHIRVVKGVDGGGWWRHMAHVGFAVNRIAIRFAGLRHLLLSAERASLRCRRIYSLLERLSPGIVVSTYPVNNFESSAIMAAQEAGILTVGQLLSWDNITSKGRLIAIPDRFVSWGPIMTDELGEYYDIPAGQVISAGVPHFDAHINNVRIRKASEFVSQMGLAADRPYVFFGMSSPIFSPEEIAIVEWLAHKIDSGAFGEDLQLLVRPHPQNVEGAMMDQSWLPRLESLQSDRVAVDFPILRRSKLPWDLEPRDLGKLVNLIGGCSICINSGSTLSIDAIVQDRPVIVTLFDAHSSRPWYDSARRIGDYIHQKKMLTLGGARVARSFEELESAIRRYLANPGSDAEGRVRVRERELGVCDGKAAERVAEALAGFLKAAC